MQNSQTVTIGGKRLCLDDFDKILYQQQNLKLNEEALAKVEECYQFLLEFSKGKVIYGINTGFGPMAQYKINEQDQIDLQYNLIRSHSSGMGDHLPDLYIKAVMLARLNTLMLAHSGVPSETVKLLADLINKNIFPVIFEHGGVGASGDLVQLAHLALGLVGEGLARQEQQLRPISEIFKQNNISPLNIKMREGLALMNGTSAMSGIGFINAILARNLLSWSVTAAVLINEVVESYDDHFSKELNYAKLHKGQRHISQLMSRLLEDSDLIEYRSEQLYNGKVKTEGSTMRKRVQEYYSLRCVPQILGPIYDTLVNTIDVLEDEVNSVNDNPIIDLETRNVYHGGNFHGDYVALEMDKLRIVVTKLSMLSERQLNFLINHKINGILPPFVNQGTLGLNFGVQGTQFTATSTTAENQMLSNPMYIHSIPNNNDNQDIVSMGSNAALMTKRVIENAYQVLAIEFVTLVQAVDCLGIEERLSSFSKKIYKELKELAPPFKKDMIFYERNERVKQHLLQNRLGLFDQMANLPSLNGIKTNK